MLSGLDGYGAVQRPATWPWAAGGFYWVSRYPKVANVTVGIGLAFSGMGTGLGSISGVRPGRAERSSVVNFIFCREILLISSLR